MEQDLEKNPNYLVMGVNEFLEASKSITERAGVLVGVVAIIITTILVLKSERSIVFADALYQYYIALVFLVIAGFFYARTFIRNATFMPIHYLLRKAEEDKIALANPDEDLPTLQSLYGKAQDNNKLKQSNMAYAHSFFLVALVIEAFVYLVSPHALVKHLHTSPIFAASTITIIALLLAYLTKLKLFAPKSERFGFGMTLVEKIHFTRDFDSFIEHTAQQAQPQTVQTVVPITPTQAAQQQPQFTVTLKPEQEENAQDTPSSENNDN